MSRIKGKKGSKRKVRRVQRVKNANKGKIKNATRLEANGRIFKSKLEKFTYDKLLENGITNFKYEEYKFTLVEPFTYNEDSVEMYERSDRTTKVKTKIYGPITNEIRAMTYLPDFTYIDETTKTGWIIEVKGYNNDAFPLKWKWFKKHLVDNGYKLSLYKPNNQGNVLKTIEIIKKRYYT